MVPLLSIFAIASSRETPLSLVEFFSTFWILDHLQTHIQHIPHSLSLFGSAVAGARRVIDLTNAPDLERFVEPVVGVAIANAGAPRKIILRNVTVRYDELCALARWRGPRLRGAW